MHVLPHRSTAAASAASAAAPAAARAAGEATASTRALQPEEVQSSGVGTDGLATASALYSVAKLVHSACVKPVCITTCAPAWQPTMSLLRSGGGASLRRCCALFRALAQRAPGRAVDLDVAGDAQESVQASRRRGARNHHCGTDGIGAEVGVRRRKAGRGPREAGVVAVDAAPARAQAAACRRASARATGRARACWGTSDACAPCCHLVAGRARNGGGGDANGSQRRQRARARADTRHGSGTGVQIMAQAAMGTTRRIHASPNALQRCLATMR